MSYSPRPIPLLHRPLVARVILALILAVFIVFSSLAFWGCAQNGGPGKVLPIIERHQTLLRLAVVIGVNRFLERHDGLAPVVYQVAKGAH